MTRFQFVLLWSDFLLWLLVFLSFAFMAYAARNPEWRRAFARLGQSRTATAAASALLFFSVLGLLDSVHYRERLMPAPETQLTPAAETAAEEMPARYSVELTSLLDALLTGLRASEEKTYSAPLAVRLYAMEARETKNGIERIYPRLKHGGARLKNENERGTRILRHLASALLLTLLVCGSLFCFWKWRRNRASENAGDKEKTSAGFAWSGVFSVFSVLLFLCLSAFFLSADFHALGTDKVGQDVLYQSLKSVRAALVIGLVTTLIMTPFAVLLGIAAGFFRGWIDDLVQYVYTVINSIPSVLLIAASALSMQIIIDAHPQWFSTAAERADIRLLALCAILGMTSWTSLARLLRGETLKLSELEYVQAARAFGVSPLRIIFRHILPNLMHIVLITLVMDFSALVLAEAVLSYVGIGVDPTMMSFGAMINNARMELSRDPAVWWSLTAAFVFMLTLVLAANLFADAVRDAFDPRQQKQR
ncbi:MAG: ABC transporter permease [Zoogloeaceae bacterium]|jgi:peptide/nickel transport system permease protein|nr:ABC transporter permease [Zoogloeaceae bacterium]